MQILHRILFVVILTLCVTSHAEEFFWRKDGKPVADSDSQKARGGFGALVLLVDDTKFFDDWKKPDAPHFKSVVTAKRMVPVHVAVIFAGPGAGPSGTADVTCDVTVLKPDGSIYGEQKGLVATRDRVPSPTMLSLADERLVVRIEPKDPSGTYTVEAVVKDNVKKVELKLKERFTVDK
jgi:hypothetical protein